MDLLKKHKSEPTYIDTPQIKKTEEEIKEDEIKEEMPKERKPRKPALRELFYLPSDDGVSK